MTRKRSIGFIATALVVAGATTAVCMAEAAAGLGGSDWSWDSFNTLVGSPLARQSRPIDTLVKSRPWITGVPGGAEGLRGKVVVVNFWTYSCINSLRTLAHLRSWNERYGDKGLVVVGVHAPEFAFEKNAANVRLAMGELGVRYPNVQDNDYQVWRKFGNQGWPGFYFIDATGRVRGHRLGEGSYADSEKLIRNLLIEAGHDLSGVPASPVDGIGVEAEADWRALRSQETYLGHARALNFASPGGMWKNISRLYVPAGSLPLNHWDLTGNWTIGSEFGTLDTPGGAIRFHFQARDAHLVLGGAGDGRPVRFRVTVDGTAPGPDHGVDVDAEGWGVVTEDRLYQLVRQTGEVRSRTVNVTFVRPGVRTYAFTFG